MKTISLLSPETFIVKDGSPNIRAYSNDFDSLMIGEMEFRNIICMISILKPDEEPILDLSELTKKENILKNTMLDAYLGLCSRLGENLFYDLINLNNLFKDEKIVKDFLKNKAKEKDGKIEKEWIYNELDFFKHQELFRFLYKQRMYEGLEEIEKLYCQKSIRRSIHKFVGDRNIYTHGRLFFYYQEKNFIVEHKDLRSTDLRFSKLSQDNLTSFAECYKDLSKIINVLYSSNRNRNN